MHNLKIMYYKVVEYNGTVFSRPWRVAMNVFYCSFFFVQFSIKSSLDCVNTYNDWQCHVWATQGECEINPDFMKVSCKRACRVCGTDEEQLGGMQFAQTH